MHNETVIRIKKIIILVPAYNEEKALPRILQDIKKTVSDICVLVINDGSVDETSHRAREAQVLVIDLPFNLGIGGAMQCGFKYARENGFEIALQIDGDGQHDPSQIQDVLAPVLRNELDLSIGSRFLKPGRGFQSTYARRMGIQFFSHLLRFLTGVYVSDPTSGYRAYGRRMIDLFSKNYPVDFPEPEAVIIAKRHGAKIGEVSVKMRKRLGGVSSIRYMKTLYYMFKVTIAILLDTLKRKS